MASEAIVRPFLFLSDSSSEAATSRLAVAVVLYIKKKLESGIANWQSIASIIDEQGVTAVLAKLTTFTLRAMIAPEFAVAAEDLLRRVSRLPHVVFVHASLFDLPTPIGGELSDDGEDEWFGAAAHFGSLEDREREEVMHLFVENGIELMPYRRNVELSVLAAQFIDDHRQNLVLRLYMPACRLWAEQAKDLLDLFGDYLTKALGLRIRTASHVSLKGTTFEFFSEDEPSEGSVIADRLSGFAEAMDLCVRDPEHAERLLVEQGADASEVARLVTIYGRRMRRLSVDMRHEREHKVLALRHQLENELEGVAEGASPASIAMLVDQVVPRADQAPGLLLGSSNTNVVPTTNVTLNYRPQIFERVHGLVAQEVTGTQNFGPDAMHLVRLIRSEGGESAGALATALHELEDGEVSGARRLDALGRLRSFLAKAASKVGDKALDGVIAAGQAYLQHRFGL